MANFQISSALETKDASFKPVPVVQKPISSVLEKIRLRKLEILKQWVASTVYIYFHLREVSAYYYKFDLLMIAELASFANLILLLHLIVPWMSLLRRILSQSRFRTIQDIVWGMQKWWVFWALPHVLYCWSRQNLNFCYLPLSRLLGAKEVPEILLEEFPLIMLVSAPLWHNL